MNAVVNESRENLAEFRAPGPGERLKAARVSLGLEPAKIAAQLHLSTDMVHAIERDDYSAMPARVFVRGYIKNYARVVGLPAENLLKQLEEQYPDEAAKSGLNRVGSDMRRELRSSHGVVRLMTWMIVLGLAVLFVLWWYGYLDWKLQTDGASVSLTEPPSSTLTAPDQDGVLALPGVYPDEQPIGAIDRLPAPIAEDASIPESPSNIPTATTASEPTAGSDPLGLVESADAARAPTVADGPISAAETTAAANAAVSQEAPSAAPPAVAEAAGPEPSSPTGGAAIVIEFSDPCWVDIRDSSKRFKLYGEMAGGRTETLGGEPPYKLVIGNAKAATIRIDGQPYDLAPHTSGNVARFTLGTN